MRVWVGYSWFSVATSIGLRYVPVFENTINCNVYPAISNTAVKREYLH